MSTGSQESFIDLRKENQLQDDTQTNTRCTNSTHCWSPPPSDLELQLATIPLILCHGKHEQIINIPAYLHPTGERLKETFIQTLVNVAKDEEIASAIELTSRFLGFLAQETELAKDLEMTLRREILQFVFEQFEQTFITGHELHEVFSNLPKECRKSVIIQKYYEVQAIVKRQKRQPESSLLGAAEQGKAALYAVFGGQGNTEPYLDELRSTYSAYSFLVRDFVTSSATHLQSLATDVDASKSFPHGLDIMHWLEDPESQPNPEYLESAPVSFPLIGLTQLVHYVVSCRVLDIHPGCLRDQLSGITGHSQGIIPAIAIAASSDWESFEVQATNALTILFWIGVRSQQAYPLASIPPIVLADARARGEGVPTPCLSVRGMGYPLLERHIQTFNNYLPQDRQVLIALVNGPTNIVVVGPPLILYNLSQELRKIKVSEHANISTSVADDNPASCITQFLPISAPFHSRYLVGAVEQIVRDLQEIRITTKNIGIPVYDTSTGEDIRISSEHHGSVVPRLVDMICLQQVHWERAIAMPGATHILDFGTGISSGIGAMTSRMKDGRGVRVILCGALEGLSTEVGYKHELFARDMGDIKYAPDWLQIFGPKLERVANGKTFVATKMSTLSGLPPIIVAGMTPTTVPWDFVASTMSAGYEIELACGGYFDRDSLCSAIMNTMDNIPLGRGIILNVIYASPKSIAWQIPLIRELCAQGIPIKGITIGAGVPSIEVANDYIRTLGIRQIGFKPSSKNSIRQVIKIAEANPTFPVILQWTGGRGGGHHSTEDFHESILNSYAQIRRCSNVVLLVGSGFGEPDETYRYLNGSWSRKYNRPPMPIDGILLGSRCMIAKEAHTSPSVKEEIIRTKGVEDHEWQKTHQPHGAGGVITVRSEMGEPIHKIATRGVLLWAELDRKIFSLPREKRRLELQKKDVRDYIMQRLYDDFQKPWFGLTTVGKLVDLQSMTYGEVINRMVELMFIKHERRWIDPSLAKLTKDFIQYIEQHFDMRENHAERSIIHTKDLLDNPHILLEHLLTMYPQIQSRLMNSQDCQQFLHLCKRSGQKPVPFVPCLDDDFEFWFKKDSLWQSEDIDAVVGQDVGRVCILQGPVAVKHSTRGDESIKDILDGFHGCFIHNLVGDEYDGNRNKIPTVECFGGKKVISMNDDFVSGQRLPANIISHQAEQYVTYSISATSVLSAGEQERWLQILGGQFGTWSHAFIVSDSFVQDRRHVSNPMHRIVAGNKEMTVQVNHPIEPERTTITITELIHNRTLTTVQIGPIRNNVIPMSLIHHQTASGKAEPLLLEFRYQPESGYAPIHEIMDSRTWRVKEFYNAIWLGDRPTNIINLPQASHVDCSSTTVTSSVIHNFAEIIGNKSETYIQRFGSKCLAPMDIAIVVGWKALVKPLLQTINGDLLALVHLSNTFSMIPEAEPFKVGDVLTTTAEITAIVNQSSGKMVEICGYIKRSDGTGVMAITSRFLYRGEFKDYADTFQRTLEKPFKVFLETPKHVAILKAKKWFNMENASTVLLGMTIIFRLKTTVTFNNHGSFASVETEGTVEVEHSTMQTGVRVASVKYSAGESQGNVVLAYLRRAGSEVDQVLYLEQPVPIGNADGSPLTFQAPASNAQYAQVSGDYNPIHTSSVFSEYVNLPGTITHGMYTSGVIRSMVENWIANNDAGIMRYFHVNFEGMVLPGDVIEVRLNHIGMTAGCKIIQIEATQASTGEKVLTGETTLKQPPTAYIFTGQGSQEQGMGMDLYAKSDVARAIWARAEKHLLETYGFSIIEIVNNNPKELTVHFGGVRGKGIRQTYMSMVRQGLDRTPSGTFRTEKLFKDITEETASYTYRSPTGLLSATQFTQPALTVMQMAAFAHSRSRGVIQKESVFAGHSLGEYSALATVAEVMELETLLSIVFYRGLCMQAAVRRDEAGRSDYSMCAVNPTRISNRFNEESLQYLVKRITSLTGSFLEIVNLNVQGMQYVCAGELRGLDILTAVTNAIKSEKIDTDDWESQTEITKQLIQQAARQTDAKAKPLELERGTATIPLPGIDVPFHSSYLRSQIHPFRLFLLKNIDPNGFDPDKLVGKYVPNVTAKPFQLTKDYFEYAYEVTKSPRLGKVLQSWESGISWDEFEP